MLNEVGSFKLLICLGFSIEQNYVTRSLSKTEDLGLELDSPLISIIQGPSYRRASQIARAYVYTGLARHTHPKTQIATGDARGVSPVHRINSCWPESFGLVNIYAFKSLCSSNGFVGPFNGTVYSRITIILGGKGNTHRQVGWY